jgi:hypothetical protein
MPAILVFLAIILASNAQAEQPKPPEVRLLTPAECSQITRRPQGEFMVKGSLTIGQLTIEDSNVFPNGLVINGIDFFEVIRRSCFSGRPS